MNTIANKTFFRFLIGFVALIGASFLIVSATGYYAQADREVATPPESVGQVEIQE